MKNYVSNEDKSAKMFDSGFMEFFTHIHPSLPLVIYVPVVAYSLYVTHAQMSASQRFFLFIGGMFVWTITEYVLHRRVFHFIPENALGKRLHFVMHGVHHDYPNDSRRLVMAPAISIPLSILFFFLFRVVCGPKFVYPFFAGFITGPINSCFFPPRFEIARAIKNACASTVISVLSAAPFPLLCVDFDLVAA